MIDRRTSLALLSAMTLGRDAAAQAWPSRPLRLIVPYGAAGSTDIVARQLAERLGQALGQPVVVENRAGATGTIGTDLVAKSAPDGQTFVIITTNQAANETLQPRRPYQLLRDLTPVAGINVYRHALVTRPDLPVTDLASLIAHSRTNPGRLNYASSGPGSVFHVATEAFRAAAGIQIEHVPYRNYNEARAALMAGQLDLMFDAIFTMAPLVAAGQVKGIATTGLTRSALLPELPTVAETLPGFEASLWNGLAGPAGLPPAITSRMNAEVNRILALPEVLEAQTRLGADVLPMTPEMFGSFLAAQVTEQRLWIQTAGVVPE